MATVATEDLLDLLLWRLRICCRQGEHASLGGHPALAPWRRAHPGGSLGRPQPVDALHCGRRRAGLLVTPEGDLLGRDASPGSESGSPGPPCPPGV